MTNETAVKLAKALGLVERHPGDDCNAYHKANGVHVCDSHRLVEWLNTAEGREAVRDRVRGFNSDTESKAYAATLLWLDERGGEVRKKR